MKNRRHTLLVDKKFQFSYALVAVLSAVLLINIAIIVAFALADPVVVSELSVTNALLLAIFEGLAIGLLTFLELKLSHRVAGPVHVIAQGFRMLADGNFNFKMHTRKHDYFHVLSEDINDEMDRLRARILAVKGCAKELEPLLDSDSDAYAAYKRLDTELSSLKADDSTSSKNGS